jgi:hypothetical protein
MYDDLRGIKFRNEKALSDTKKMYRLVEKLTASKKLDFEFSLVTLFTGAMFFGDLKNSTKVSAFSINIALFITEVAWDILGSRAVKTRSAQLMYAFWTLSIFLPAFIVNVAVDAFTVNNLFLQVTHTSVRVTIGLFGVLALLNRALTVVLSVLLYRRFDDADYAQLQDLLAKDPRTIFKPKAKAVPQQWRPGHIPSADSFRPASAEYDPERDVPAQDAPVVVVPNPTAAWAAPTASPAAANRAPLQRVNSLDPPSSAESPIDMDRDRRGARIVRMARQASAERQGNKEVQPGMVEMTELPSGVGAVAINTHGAGIGPVVADATGEYHEYPMVAADDELPYGLEQ